MKSEESQRVNFAIQPYKYGKRNFKNFLVSILSQSQIQYLTIGSEEFGEISMLVNDGVNWTVGL